MLAYRHAFHAGNHADVLKHATLVAVLRHLNAKDKAWRLVDTHAGAGAYALHAEQAQKHAEYKQGIARLWQVPDLPPLLADYLAQVKAFNPHEELAAYPGSPCITRALMRAQDQLRLFELHPADHILLADQFAARIWQKGHAKARQFPLPVLHGERVRVRGGRWLRPC